MLGEILGVVGFWEMPFDGFEEVLLEVEFFI
jgi:hypothetical protein